LRRYGILTVFQNDGRTPSSICSARVETTYDEHLMVFNVVQNLAGINVVVMITSRLSFKKFRFHQNPFMGFGAWSKFAVSHYFGYWLLQQRVLP